VRTEDPSAAAVDLDRTVIGGGHIVSPPAGRYLAADRASEKGNAIGRVRLFPDYLLNQPTVKLDFMPLAAIGWLVAALCF